MLVETWRRICRVRRSRIGLLSVMMMMRIVTRISLIPPQIKQSSRLLWTTITIIIACIIVIPFSTIRKPINFFLMKSRVFLYFVYVIKFFFFFPVLGVGWWVVGVFGMLFLSKQLEKNYKLSVWVCLSYDVSMRILYFKKFRCLCSMYHLNLFSNIM